MNDSVTLSEMLNNLESINSYTDTINETMVDIKTNQETIMERLEIQETLIGCILLTVVLMVIWKFVKELLP